MDFASFFFVSIFSSLFQLFLVVAYEFDFGTKKQVLYVCTPFGHYYKQKKLLFRFIENSMYLDYIIDHIY
jgi:hypothetical protein